MKKYNKQLIFDYISGNEIEEYDIDELENDVEFMKDVITITKDKNMLNLCSDEVKRDYEFVKTIINLFKDDIKLICEIADNYLNYYGDTDPEKFFELNIIMNELTKHYKEENIKYLLGVKMQLNWDNMHVEYMKKDKEDDFKKCAGLGFIYYLTIYPNNEIILNYVANDYLDELLINIMDFEVYLHKNYESYEKFEEAGKYDVLFNVVSKYDQNLLNYIKSNKKLLELIDLKFQKIKYGWNSCEMRLNDDKIYYAVCVVEAIEKYMDEYLCECDFEFNYITNYIAKKLGIEKQVEKVYPPFDFDEEIEEDGLELYELCNPKEMNVNDFKHYKAMKNLAEDILNGKVEDEYDVCKYHDAIFNPSKQKKK